MRTLFRVFVLSLLVIATPAVFAADPIFRVGFTGVQVRDVPGGRIHYVEIEVASNEENSEAKLWNIAVRLTAAGGKYFGSETIYKQTKLRPPIRLLRFQVFYPITVINGKPVQPTIGLAKIKYTLFARLDVKDPETNTVVKVVTNEISYDIAGGGTASCQLQ